MMALLLIAIGCDRSVMSPSEKPDATSEVTNTLSSSKPSTPEQLQSLTVPVDSLRAFLIANGINPDKITYDTSHMVARHSGKSMSSFVDSLDMSNKLKTNQKELTISPSGLIQPDTAGDGGGGGTTITVAWGSFINPGDPFPGYVRLGSYTEASQDIYVVAVRGDSYREDPDYSEVYLGYNGDVEYNFWMAYEDIVAEKPDYYTTYTWLQFGYHEFSIDGVHSYTGSSGAGPTYY